MPEAAPATPAPAASTDTTTTLLTDPAKGTPNGGTPAPNGGDPNANPDGQPSAGAKPDGGTPDPSKTPKPDDKPQGAPEKYVDFKLPDGVTLAPKLAEEFKTVAKELNLTQDAAQKLVDLQAKGVAQAMQQTQAEFQRMNEEWKKETMKALGPDPDAELAFAAKARDQFASPELLKLLKDSGMGNHPDVVKLFVKLGKAVAEDRFADGKGSQSKTKDPAEVLYGGTK